MQYIQMALDYLVAHKLAFATIAGVLLSVAKMVSNVDAGPVISKIQALVDAAAKAVAGIGSILKFVSDFLANLIKSDGFLGKK